MTFPVIDTTATHHYPAHAPDRDELTAMGENGWNVVGSIITPPETPHSVPGLLIFWQRHQVRPIPDVV